MRFYIIKGFRTIYEGTVDASTHNIIRYYKKREDGTFGALSVEDMNIAFNVDKARKEKKLLSFPNLQMAINYLSAQA